MGPYVNIYLDNEAFDAAFLYVSPFCRQIVYFELNNNILFSCWVTKKCCVLIVIVNCKTMETTRQEGTQLNQKLIILAARLRDTFH